MSLLGKEVPAWSMALPGAGVDSCRGSQQGASSGILIATRTWPGRL